MCERDNTGRTYERKRSDQTMSKSSCETGAVHIWHLDEVVVTISGQKHWLWRAVDQDGYVLDEVVQTRRNTTAAKRLLRRLLKKQGGPPRRMITDKLGSYAAARSQIMPEVEHRSQRGSTIGRRIRTCHSGDASGRGKAFDPPDTCSGSSVCSRPSAIFSFHPAPTAPPLPPISTASTPWRNGSLWPTLLLEPVW
jgi:putative transposase